jgi:type IV secretory pathway TrbF-like protein
VSTQPGQIHHTASNTATVERMNRYEIAAFIRNARLVSSDPAVEQNMLNDLLAHALTRLGAAKDLEGARWLARFSV